MPVSFGATVGKVVAPQKKRLNLPVTDGLVAYFDANNPNSYPGAGYIWQDLSPNKYVASLNSTIVGYNNRYGGHLTMAPDGDRVKTPAQASVTSFSSNTVTLMSWINPSATQDGYAGLIVERNTASVGMQLNAGTRLYLMYGGGTFGVQDYTFNTGIIAPPNQWSLLTIVITPTSITPYLNGTPGNVLTGTVPAATFSLFRLGWDNGAYRVFNGKYGAALIYNKSLSAAEVSSMYDYFKTRYIVPGSNLKLHIDAGDSLSYSGSGTTVTDLSGNGLNCTLTNGPTYSNGAFVLDGVDDYINTNSTVDLRSDFTLEGWFSMNNDTDGKFFGHGNTSGATSQSLHALFIPNSSRGYLFGMYSNDASATTVGITRPKNSWYHIAITYSHSAPYTKKMYVNGVDVSLAAEQTQAAYTFGLSTLKIGANFGVGVYATSYHAGKIAQARYYNKVLSASEVLQNYNATKTIFYNQDLPTVSSAPKLWLKADGFGAARDSSDNIITTDNTQIAKMFDYSGFQNHAIQNTSNVQPSYRSAANGINGKPAIQFATKNLQVANFTRTAWTTFIVFKCSSDTLLYEHGTSWDQPGGYLYTNTNSSLAIRNAANNTVSWRDYTAAWGSDNVTKLAVQRFNGTNASHILKINGTQVTLTDRNAGDPGVAAVTATLNIGGRNGSGMGAFYLCEMIMFDTALSDSDVEKIESYLRRKWNLV